MTTQLSTGDELRATSFLNEYKLDKLERCDAAAAAIEAAHVVHQAFEAAAAGRRRIYTVCSERDGELIGKHLRSLGLDVIVWPQSGLVVQW